MASQSLRSLSPLTSHAICKSSVRLFSKTSPPMVALPRGIAVYSSAQESSTATVSDTKEATSEAKESKPTTAAKSGPAKKPKKAPVKALPEMMAEEVIPQLKAILENEEDVSQVALSFQDNRLEGSFVKKNIPYFFWAFFPNGDLTGPKGFSLSSYGSEASTVEPFLIDEKKITHRHVIFWVQKRLAAQGILPVWKEDEGAE